MIEQLLNRAVVIHRAGGDPVETTGALQQASADEAEGHGEFSITGWRLWLRADEEIGTADQVEVDGDRYSVNGEPWRVADEGTGQIHHIEARLVRTGSSEPLGGDSGEEDF